MHYDEHYVLAFERGGMLPPAGGGIGIHPADEGAMQAGWHWGVSQAGHR